MRQSCTTRSISGSSVTMAAPTTGPSGLASAAKHDIQERDGGTREVELVGIDEQRLMGVESAGDAGDQRAERERQQLGPRQIDAHRLGGDVVLVDRDHGAAEPDMADAPDDEDRRSRRRATTCHSSVSGANAAHARRPAGRLEIEEEHANDLAEAERQDHHVDAADAQRRRADDQPRQCRGAAPPADERKTNGTSALVKTAQT